MSTILVEEPGLLTTVQDLGREGFGPLGVSASGAADPIALRLGNRLVGNSENAAALEMTLVGGAFVFPEGGVVALTGSDFGATLDDADVGTWESLDVPRGATLRVGPSRSGARGYLCVQGGIAVTPFLGSASTHVMTGLGGHDGRPLRAGDVLEIGAAAAPFRKRTVDPSVFAELWPHTIADRTSGEPVRIRVTDGEQSAWFAESARRAFAENVYRVGEDSNRIGIRLEGTPIAGPSGGRMLTEGVSLGAVQLAPGGLPVILFVEQQTTGGYPKIANVIAADLASLGQLRAGDAVRFERVQLAAARIVLFRREQVLRSRKTIVE
jgi:antagonist of KipI